MIIPFIAFSNSEVWLKTDEHNKTDNDNNNSFFIIRCCMIKIHTHYCNNNLYLILWP